MISLLELEGLGGVADAGKLALMFLCEGLAVAQQRTISARAGTINYQQGLVYVDDQRVHATYGDTPRFQMKNGQRLRIETGRVELLLGSGVYLRMLGPSAIRMQDTQLADTRLSVEDGSTLIEVAGMNKQARLTVICGEATTELRRDGSFRFDAPLQGIAGRLRIYSGDALVARDRTEVRVKSGLAVDLGSGLKVSKFNLKAGDGLKAWADRRSQRRIDNERRRAESRAMQAAKHSAEN
jgi:hypothetical protein